MIKSKEYGFEYWDGDRRFGYGGYKYDGRWEVVAKDLINEYNLKDGAKILDVGCGKGFLLYELKKLLPNIKKPVSLVVWTTTPWTLPANMLIAVNPKFEYAKVKVKDEVWILAKEKVEVLMEKFGIEDYEILEI